MVDFTSIRGDISDPQNGSDAFTLWGDLLDLSSSGVTGTLAATLPALTGAFALNSLVPSVTQYYTISWRGRNGDFTDAGLNKDIAGRDFTSSAGAPAQNVFTASFAITLPSLTASFAGISGQATRDGTPVSAFGPAGPTPRRDFGGARTVAPFDAVLDATLPALTADFVLENQNVSSFDVTLPALTGLFDVVYGDSDFFDATLPALTGAFQVGVEVEFSFSAQFPVIEASFVYVESPGLWYDIQKSAGSWIDI